MRWEGERESANVEDRRGMSPGMMVGGGGIVTVVIVLIAMFLGADPQQVLQNMPQQPGGGQGSSQVDPNFKLSPEQEKLGKFVSVVLADTEDVWTQLFRQQGMQYEEPKMVLFTGQVNTACGGATAAVGPFYCPGDRKVYIDLDFYDQLKRQLHSPGDFAQAYVIAHEVGHHVQNLLGTSGKVDRARTRASEVEANELSVRLELQADFYAGVWAHHAQRTKNILEPGDIEEALNAAHNIGDDALQRQVQGTVVPDSFTHGTSAQRMKWFKLGYDTGDMTKGDTFSIPYNRL
ncbi:MAG: neutral zinc metallopeptidase [Tepidisphaeraceae bacterium]